MERFLICDYGTQYAREPVLRRMKNGDLICLSLTGGEREPGNDNVTMVTRSRDDGRTWSAPEVLFCHGARGVWTPELFSEGDAPIAFVLTYNAENHYRELQTFVSYGDDEGRAWSEPVSMPGAARGVSVRQGIVLSNGEWLFPIYWQETRGGFDWTTAAKQQKDWPMRCGVLISSDRGKRFTPFGRVAAEHTLWEPNCVEAEPGHIVMMMRDGARTELYRSDSFDYGRTWSAPEASKIPNPSTKCTLCKVNGHLLMINNFCGDAREHYGARTNLELRISDDAFRSWSRVIPLTPPEERFFYPHAYVDDAARTLYVAYENGFKHYLVKLSYAELGVL